MKIKKLLPEQVTNKSLGYKEYRKALKPALQMMETSCNSPETAVDCLIKTDFVFSDMPGKKMGLIIVGNQSGAWLQCAKEQIKDDKKFTLVGSCYISSNDDGTKTLVVLPKRGNAKQTLVSRQVQKFALKGYPYSLQVGEELASEEEEASAEPNSAAAGELSKEQLIRKKNMEARMKKMGEQIARLKAQFNIV